MTTIRITRNTFIAGQLFEAGQDATVSEDAAAAVTSAGKAVRIEPTIATREPSVEHRDPTPKKRRER